MTQEAAHKLVDEIAPKLKGRTSGHVRVEKTTLRRGDNTQMARISFVDDLKAKPKASQPKAEPKAQGKNAGAKKPAKKESK
jgi:hypothetical protein